MEIYFIILIAVQGIIDITLFRRLFTHDGCFLGILDLLRDLSKTNELLYREFKNITKKETEPNESKN